MFLNTNKQNSETLKKNTQWKTELDNDLLDTSKDTLFNN